MSHDKSYLKYRDINIALQIVNMSFDCDTRESVRFKLETFLSYYYRGMSMTMTMCKNNGTMVNYEGVEHQSGTTRTGCL